MSLKEGVENQTYALAQESVRIFSPVEMYSIGSWSFEAGNILSESQSISTEKYYS